MNTRRHHTECTQGGKTHSHTFHAVTDFTEARFGDVFARPNSGHDLRVMFIAYGTNSYGEGWSGIEVAGPLIGRFDDGWVEDGWEKVE